jgi:nicotinic acid mononucleotide adenylyltransferase
VAGGKATLLLGAFDPPTNAHLAILTTAARVDDAPGALCLTKVALARSGEQLLDGHDRIDVLHDIAERCGFGFAMANRGTYLDVGRTLRADGLDVTFAIGSDKLEQLADPSFYKDGEAGVGATFAELRFVVVPRPGHPSDGRIPLDEHAERVRLLEPGEVFPDDGTANISATEVRRLYKEGRGVDHLVPPEVSRRLPRGEQ